MMVMLVVSAMRASLRGAEMYSSSPGRTTPGLIFKARLLRSEHASET